ncbi:EamA family transporter [Deltaproteobacteria bacterium Smac51]|nr:EamA family transporter [Deltaproteobacteria bacterium Smac51]
MSECAGKFYLAGAFILAGTSVVSMKYLAIFLGPFTIISVSLIISIISVGAFCFGNISRNLRVMDRRAWLMIVLQATFGIFIFRLLLLAGLNRTSAGEAGLLTGAVPAITAFLALTILKERLSRLSALGILGTVAGIAVLNGRIDGGFHQHLWGNLMILGAAASESIFNICSRLSWLDTKTAALHPLSRTVLVSGLALLFCLLPAYLENPLTSLRGLEFSGWLALVWQGLFVTIVSYCFWFAGIKRCEACTAAAFSGLMPLSAVAFSILLLGEALVWRQMAGGLLILTGMSMLAARRS